MDSEGRRISGKRKLNDLLCAQNTKDDHERLAFTLETDTIRLITCTNFKTGDGSVDICLFKHKA